MTEHTIQPPSATMPPSSLTATPGKAEEGLSSQHRVSYTPSDIERLGRERPPSFRSLPHELGFCFALLGSMFVAEYMISGFNILLPDLSAELNIPSNAQTWPASVFSLVTGAFLLPFGRLADIFGGYLIFNIGLGWFLIWSIIAGFSQNYIMLIVCRALQGFGPAAFLPAGIMLLGSIYRPGPRKNLVFSLYGAFAPVGFFTGIFFAGVAAQFITWGWFFWIGSIILAIVGVAAYFCIPNPRNEKEKAKEQGKSVKMDWWGTATVVPGLVLVVFALTDGSHAPQGWATPYIPVTFVIGWLFLGAFIYIEGRVAEQPLLPGDMFSVKGMKPLAVALFFQYGTFGIFIFYASFYIEQVVGASPLLTAAWFTPMCIGGLILATIGGLILHLLPGRILLLVSGTAYILSTLLFAIVPAEFNYWAYIFPAMICATLGIDITYNVSNIFITTSLPKARQGLAGSFMNSLLFLGIAVYLSFADLAVSETEERGKRQSYKVAFWLATALAGAGLIIMFLGVKIGKAKSDLTIEEREELENELVRRTTDE
ncbi:MFS general substrate transporter [Stemphylium lycopersici]|uniref:MFS general substrate transporter n=1 Tax=Stemphylium lycopersici TaxID=183478 RepID=A0A364MVE2_STELY|nr:major facilitator superfamily transporter [Stemphylium lycopersici]RAR04465.1 MFS general substrate transporter [Stemphylium lycopersici]RAR04942.1 MFS general substrate transporter [Stemphylium lycopersici]